jgi:hypothetical protein
LFDGSEVSVASPDIGCRKPCDRALAVLLLALVLVAYLAPRLVALDHLVTVDEGY